MNSKQIDIFKTVLFVVGFIVIGVIFTIFNYPIPDNGLKASQIFFWINIVICYIALFVPFFFSSFVLKTIDTKIISKVTLWICICIFELITVTFSILSFNEVVTVRLSILFELITFFLATVFVYLGYFSGMHIGNTKTKELEISPRMSELKHAFEILNLKADEWGNEQNNQKNIIKKFCDDVKYMSPVYTDLASNLEMRLIFVANVLAESELSADEIDSKITELKDLINQRKLLINKE